MKNSNWLSILVGAAFVAIAAGGFLQAQPATNESSLDIAAPAADTGAVSASSVEDGPNAEPSVQISISIQDEDEGRSAPAESVSASAEPRGEERREWRRIDEVVRILGEARVEAGEETSDMVVVFGEGTMEGRTRGDMVVVLGRVYIDGTVGGDLVAPLSRVVLGPQARIRGDLVMVGGKLEADPQALIEGQQVDMTWERLREIPGFTAVESFFDGLKGWVGEGLFLGRLIPHHWGWWWWMVIGLATTYFFLALVAPRAVSAGTEELEEQPVTAFFMGILGYILVNVLFLVLTATGVGVLVVPFFLIAVFIIQMVGKASVFQLIGYRIGRQSSSGGSMQPLPALLLGLALFTLLYMVPILGIMAWLVTAPLGFGAALLASLRALRPGGATSLSSSQLGMVPVMPPVMEPRVELPSAGSDEVEGNAPRSPAGVSAVGPIAGPPPVMDAYSPRALGDTELTSLPRAGFWIRTGASALDLLVVLMPLAVMDGAKYFLFAWLAYHTAFWAWRGTTVGGVVCRLKIVRTDGKPLNFAVALVRALAGVLSAFALFLGFFWAGWTREKLGWHDMIAGTAVVRVPVGSPLI
jgi:uncharacterized RDD family membrane protein YckC/cytoskeletal protein CcmA (bactofilin family)